MNTKLRYVFDTNVIVSALLFSDSVPGQAFFHALDCGMILMSHSLAEELSDVLGREKFSRYVTLEERECFLGSLIRGSELVEIVDTVQVCRDPKDNRILELALNGNAAFVVTGDSDLLVLNSYGGAQIVTSSQFLGLVGR
jgi:putative PIN family toxin of toxin-antitoxin system